MKNEILAFARITLISAIMLSMVSVSNTHQTLPTNREV
jgi:hypothetical protein